MNLKSIFLLGALLFFCSLANAQQKEKINPIDKQLKACLDTKENQTTAGMCDCTYEALDKWDKQLNVVYKALSSKLNTTAKTKLVEAQRQWVKFKEKEVELIDATYGSADGTMWRIVRASKVLQLTKERAVELESLLETLESF
ncbi:lysozyme inhibitor LprI family protein [Pontibacter sp. MBLB2868]|uniref:lysozyme inhibitor LprI family protein n=1 Tax=Pontibacter sp. MBLB2868 TaxID=3451555 RepID=UPI003F75704A